MENQLKSLILSKHNKVTRNYADPNYMNNEDASLSKAYKYAKRSKDWNKSFNNKNYEIPAPQKLLQTEYHPKICEFSEGLLIEPTKFVNKIYKRSSDSNTANSSSSRNEPIESKGCSEMIVTVKDVPSMSKTVFNFKKKKVCFQEFSTPIKQPTKSELTKVNLEYPELLYTKCITHIRNSKSVAKKEKT